MGHIRECLYTDYRHNSHHRLKANIPLDIIIRIYYTDIRNFFNIYMNCVIFWVLANNTNGSSEYIAEGEKGTNPNIFDLETYNKVLHYVRR